MNEKEALRTSEAAKILGTDQMQVYKLVTTCENCKKSLVAHNKEKRCTCENSQAYLKSFNVGMGEKGDYRIERTELENFKKEREL